MGKERDQTLRPTPTNCRLGLLLLSCYVSQARSGHETQAETCGQPGDLANAPGRSVSVALPVGCFICPLPPIEDGQPSWECC